MQSHIKYSSPIMAQMFHWWRRIIPLLNHAVPPHSWETSDGAMVNYAAMQPAKTSKLYYM